MSDGTSALRGIGAYKARKDEADARREAAEANRVQRFALQKDGSEAVVRFAQEVDPSAKNYDDAQGIGFVNIEHNHPDPKQGWKNRANCSNESQGSCFACEKVRDESKPWDVRKGWKQKEKFYANVIAGEPTEVEMVVNGKNVTKKFPTNIDKKTGDGEVYLLEQGTYNGIWDQLVENALEDETITANFWKIKRKGSGFNDTSYTLTKLAAVPADAKKLSEFELVNIEEKVLREVPYDQQEAFYYKGLEDTVEAVTAPVESAPAGEGAKSPDEW